MGIKITSLLLLLICISSCFQPEKKVSVTHGVDESAGGDFTYIITTPAATYFLEKKA